MPSELKSASPDGRFRMLIDPWEARNSLWVESPTLIEAASGAVLLRFQSQMWSLDLCTWLSDTQATLALRKYPGNHTPPNVFATVDCEHRIATVPGSAAVALENLEALLDRQLTWK